MYGYISSTKHWVISMHYLVHPPISSSFPHNHLYSAYTGFMMCTFYPGQRCTPSTGTSHHPYDTNNVVCLLLLHRPIPMPTFKWSYTVESSSNIIKALNNNQTPDRQIRILNNCQRSQPSLFPALLFDISYGGKVMCDQVTWLVFYYWV